MSDEGMNYFTSPIPPEKPDRAIGVDDRGRMTYASAAAEGMVEIELPSLPGSPNSTERMLAKNFGPIIAGKIEASMNRQGYLTSGSQQGPAEVLQHYLASAKGAKLLDQDTLDYAARLHKEFAAEKGEHRQAYFQSTVKPFLHGLTPRRRKR
jgi:hypothetical protein